MKKGNFELSKAGDLNWMILPAVVLGYDPDQRIIFGAAMWLKAGAMISYTLKLGRR